MATSADFVAGKVGYVVVADSQNVVKEFAMGEWRFPAEATFVARNNYKSRGYQEGVSGFKKSRFTIKGPYAKDDSPIIVGETYRFFLGIEDASILEFYADGHVSRMNVVNNAEGSPEIEYECDSVGPFSISSLGLDEFALDGNLGF